MFLLHVVPGYVCMLDYACLPANEAPLKNKNLRIIRKEIGNIETDPLRRRSFFSPCKQGRSHASLRSVCTGEKVGCGSVDTNYRNKELVGHYAR